MPLFAWCSRRAGGLSLVLLIALCYYVISTAWSLERRSRGPWAHSDTYPSSSSPATGAWTLVFAYYCLLIHFLVFTFPLRACWSVWDITRSLKRAARSKALDAFKKPNRHRRASAASTSSSETLASDSVVSDSQGYSSTASEASDVEADVHVVGPGVACDPVIHAIIIPNYKEDMDTLRETLEVLASHPQAHLSYHVSRHPTSRAAAPDAIGGACACMHAVGAGGKGVHGFALVENMLTAPAQVYLGMEQREANVEAKALHLVGEFAKKFGSIDYTIHPADIPGEAAGKGSNVGWAARRLSTKYSVAVRRNVIVTGIDGTATFNATARPRAASSTRAAEPPFGRCCEAPLARIHCTHSCLVAGLTHKPQPIAISRTSTLPTLQTCTCRTPRRP